MKIQKLTHYIDSMLTQELARMELKGGKVVVAWYTNQQNNQSVVHSHPYHEFVLPIRGGNIFYSISGSIFEVRPGELIFFPAEKFHSGQFDKTSDISERLIIQVDKGIWDAAMKKSGIHAPSWQEEVLILDIDTISSWDFRGLFERMAQAADLKGQYCDAVLECELAELQLLMNLAIEARHLLSPNSTSALVTKVVDYMEEHYTDPSLTVAELAQYAFTSREHLSRAFKEYKMESVHTYLTHLRMQHCRRAMISGASVLDACMESGFSNYSSFLKTFHKLYGITPADYKKKLKSLPEPMAEASANTDTAMSPIDIAAASTGASAKNDL